MQKTFALPHRRVLRFVGKDAQSFIQGLFSNDVLKVAPATQPMVYGAFLNGNGRVVTDGFVFYDENLLSNKEHTPAEELFAEVDKEHCEKLLRHLEAFKMRADVQMSLMDDIRVKASLVAAADEAAGENMDSEGKSELKQKTAEELSAIITPSSFTDPRKSLENIRRSYLTKSQDEAAIAVNSNTTDDYLAFLYERGIAEGSHLWSQVRLPFEGNLDIVGGIHYEKGCYIGQELVQRAKNQLVSSKRIVAFQSTTMLDAAVELNDPKTNKAVAKVIHCVQKDKSDPLDSPNTNVSGEKLDKMSNEDFVGVCSLRLAEALNPETLDAILEVKGANNALKVNVNVPYWWPDDEIDKCIPLAAGEPSAEKQ